MADGDRQLAFTTGDLPVSVQVSGADKLTPKAVNASFDGTGAGSAFLPCLIITGRTGHEVARIPGPQIAAGASAEVSWFPRVAGASGAAPSDIAITDEYPSGPGYNVPGDGTSGGSLWARGTGHFLLDYSVPGQVSPLVSGIYAITINVAMVTAVYNKPSVMTTLLHVDHIGIGWQTYQKAVCVLNTEVAGSPGLGVETPATIHTLPPLELHPTSIITIDTRQGSGGVLAFSLTGVISKLN